MFEKIIKAPADPILGLTDEFKADLRSDKINLGAGIYKDETGETPILSCVKTAEARLVDTEKTKSYLSIEGTADYAKAVQSLVFGAGSALITQHRAKTAHAPGGTGALKIAAEFISKQLDSTTIWISDPTWANHISIFESSGLSVKKYRYHDKINHCLDFNGFIEDIAQANSGDVILLHACCHNPTGIDPSTLQWQELLTLIKEKQLLPLFDFAYQGFATGINEDASAIRLFAENLPELLIASSFSKNFGMYNERVGAFTLVAKEQKTASIAFSQIKQIIRSIYSNPPSHGGAVVTEILKDPQLAKKWCTEVTDMRVRIHKMRTLFVNELKAHGVTQDFSFIQAQNGMFSFSGLTPEQVKRLKEEFGIYIVNSGRISVAGMTETNIKPLCQAIAQIL